MSIIGYWIILFPSLSLYSRSLSPTVFLLSMASPDEMYISKVFNLLSTYETKQEMFIVLTKKQVGEERVYLTYTSISIVHS